MKHAASILIIWLSLALLSGCASSSGTASQTEQLAAQVQAQAKSKSQSQTLQQHLLSQGLQPAAPRKSQAYQIGPEDLLSVQFLGLPDQNREVRVDNHGEISLPLIGTVKAAGLTAQQLERTLVGLYKPRSLANPQLTVFVKEYRHQRVAVTGAVGKPGYYEMMGPHTLLEMLAMAGGLSDAAGDKVHLIRPRSPAAAAKSTNLAAAPASFHPQAETVVIDLRRLLEQGALELNYEVRQGDVIHVPFAGFAYVLGEVREPGKVPVKQDLTVTQAIALAKGTTSIAAQKRITIMRFDEQGNRLNLEVDLDQVTKGNQADIAMKENDIVVVPDHLGKRGWETLKTLIRGSMTVPVK